jgi:putative spermidine/putrescine transport system substrate-binding protein
MKRRHLLQSFGILALEPLLFGCQSAPPDRLEIQFLKKSLPTLLINEFQKQVKGEINASTIAQLANSLELLTKWSKPAPLNQNWRLPWQAAPKTTAANLITLGDTWLASAIDQNLIKPLAASKIPNWSKLDARWQQLVTKDAKTWGAPYRWGSTVLIYRRDKLQQNNMAMPTDWSDLWRPEFKKRISLLNQQQEIIGLTLKQLGHSYNTDPLTVTELPDKLRQLHQQTALYSSDDYLSPLLAGDTWLAVAWSQDVTDLIDRLPHLGLVVPKTGTSLWADLWVQPQSAPPISHGPTLEQWIDFCWQPLIADQISRFTTGLSPLATKQPNNQSVITADTFAKGEFLPALSIDRQKSYQMLWRAMQA